MESEDASFAWRMADPDALGALVFVSRRVYIIPASPRIYSDMSASCAGLSMRMRAYTRSIWLLISYGLVGISLAVVRGNEFATSAGIRWKHSPTTRFASCRCPSMCCGLVCITRYAHSWVWVDLVRGPIINSGPIYAFRTAPFDHTSSLTISISSRKAV